ncbi:MAG: S1 RNA-binding domain-containing protein, partial [Spirochaetaceae bacterium]|nr:S1 RNA-binding domain-containing protein [Spirochaetaceae bacterium]
MAEKDVVMNESQDAKENVQTQLQEEYLKSLDSLEEGQLKEGVVIQVTSDQVFVDIGYKSEGRIPISEFSILPKIGDKVNVVLVSKEGRHGEVIVSKQKADSKAAVKIVRQAFNDKTPIEGTIEKVVKGGFSVNFGGDTTAFLPISQSDTSKVDHPEKLVGLKSKFYIDRLYSDNKLNVVVSRRKYLEETMQANRNEFFNNVKIGSTVEGEVKSFTSFGAFIDLGG